MHENNSDEWRVLLGRSLLRLLADTLTLADRQQRLIVACRDHDAQNLHTLSSHLEALTGCAAGLQNEVAETGVPLPPTAQIKSMSSIQADPSQLSGADRVQRMQTHHEQLIRDVESVRSLVPMEMFPSTDAWLLRKIVLHQTLRQELIQIGNRLV